MGQKNMVTKDATTTKRLGVSILHNTNEGNNNKKNDLPHPWFVSSS